MVEIWKDCFGFEDYYKVSNLGNIWRKEREIIDSLGRKRVLGSKKAVTFIAGSGYEYVATSINGKRINRRVHRLVLQTFEPIPNYDDMTVNHIDGEKLNNSLDNLEWMTHKENINHAWETGLMTAPERTLERLTLECEECGLKYSTTNNESRYCSYDCVGMSSRVVRDRPSKDELYELLCDNSFLEVGRRYEVSDNAIRKWCKSYGIPYKAKYYRGKSK